MREVLHHIEQIALLVEHHERSAGGDVFEGDAALKFASGQGEAGGTRDLHGLRIASAAVLEDVLYRHAKGILIDPGSFTITADTEKLGAAGLLGTDGAEPVSAVNCNQRSGHEGLDVIDHGGLVHVAVCDRERRTLARDTAFALQGFDQ